MAGLRVRVRVGLIACSKRRATEPETRPDKATSKTKTQTRTGDKTRTIDKTKA